MPSKRNIKKFIIHNAFVVIYTNNSKDLSMEECGELAEKVYESIKPFSIDGTHIESARIKYTYDIKSHLGNHQVERIYSLEEIECGVAAESTGEKIIKREVVK